MADGKAFEAIVSIAGKVDPSLEKSIAKAQKSTIGFGKGLKIAGAIGAAGLAAVGTATVAATKGLLDLGEEYKAASNTIRIGTGATGTALDDLNDSMKNVYKSVPTDLESASSSIADLNTRLGLTGDNLEMMSKQSLMVTKTLGDDTSGVIEESSQAFQQWNVSADNMSSEMDYIFKVSQSTGMGFTSLMTAMQSSGATLQDLGYSFDESAAMIGSLDKAGIDSNVVLAAMKKGLAGVAESGGDVKATMADYITQIENAESTTDALAIASGVFGSKASVTMVQAIQRGALSADDLTTSLQESSESILTAAKDTYTLSDRFNMIKSKGKNLLEPVASGTLEIVEEAFPLLESAMDNVIPVLQSGAQQIMPIVEGVSQNIFPVITQGFNSVMPVVQSLIPVFLYLFTSIAGSISQIGGLIGNTLQQILPTIMLVIGEAGNLIMASFQTIGPCIEQIMQQMQPLIQLMISNIIPIIQSVTNSIKQSIPFIVTILKSVMGIISQIISVLATLGASIFATVMPAAKQLFEAIQSLRTILLQVLAQVLPILQSWLSVLMPILKLVAKIIGVILGGAIANAINLLTHIINVVRTVLSVFSGVISFFQGFIASWISIWQSVSGAVESAFIGLVGIVKAPINTIIGMVNGVIDKINSVKITVPDWVPKPYGGKSFSIGIPNLPMLASGGLTQGPSIAGEDGQEMVISFNPKYRDSNIDYWKRAGQMLGVVNESAKTGQALASDEGYSSILEHKTTNNNSNYVIEKMEFNPTIIIRGDAKKEDIKEAIDEAKEDFFDRIDEWWDDKTGGGNYEPVF